MTDKKHPPFRCPLCHIGFPLKKYRQQHIFEKHQERLVNKLANAFGPKVVKYMAEEYVTNFFKKHNPKITVTETGFKITDIKNE